MKYALLLLLLCSAAFADVGPGPAKPDITVTFTKGGAPYSGDATLVFHCLENVSGSGAVGENEVAFTCSSGVCRNENWFYKFNPCFHPSRGYFMYATGGDALVRSSEVSFEQGGWNVVIDADTGEASQSLEQRFTCPFPLMVLASLSILAFRAGSVWN